MGRKPTSVRFNSMVFRELFKDLNYSKIVDERSVTRQALNGWLNTGRIPPKAMAEIVKAHNVSPNDVERLMDVPKEPIYKTHYWLCEPCANKFGGKFPERHIFTVTVGECKHCHEKDVTLIPWVDFNWPNEKTEHLRD